MKKRLKKGWRREGPYLISPSGYREVDMSQLRTIPITERMQGWAHGAQIGKPNPTPPPRQHAGWPNRTD